MAPRNMPEWRRPNAPRTTHPTTNSNFQKRDSDCDVYSASSCSTHRTVLLIIIILVGAFAAIVLSLVYVRSRHRRIARMHANQSNRFDARAWRQQYLDSDVVNGRRMHDLREGGLREDLRTSDGTATVRLPSDRVVGVDGGRRWRKVESLGEEEPPPPYMPRVPEAVRVGR
jgi:hypothetical protein